jgi:hypothetical protein
MKGLILVALAFVLATCAPVIAQTPYPTVLYDGTSASREQRNLAAGVCTYRLEYGGVSEVKRMILVR